MNRTLKNRLSQLEAKIQAQAELRRFAELDLSTDRGQRTACIFRNSQTDRRPMTIAQASVLATKIEQALAKMEAIEHGEDWQGGNPCVSV